MIYEYSALTIKGQQTHGFINAKSLKIAKTTLATHGLRVTALSLHLWYTIRSVFSADYRGIQDKHLEDFSASFRDLVDAGVSISEVLDILKNSMQTPLTKASLERVKILVEDQGLSISDALQKAGFPEFYTSQLSVGFESGAPVRTLDRLIDFYKWKYESAWEIKKLCFYPAFLLGFVVLFLLGIIFVVMPKLSDLFEGKTDLPALTSIMYNIGTGEVFKDPTQLMMLLTGFAVSIFLAWKGFKFVFKKFFLMSSPTSVFAKNPLVKFYQMTVLNTYISALSTSISEGFSLSLALQRSAAVFVHRDSYYRQLAEKAVEQSEDGIQLLKIIQPFLVDESLAVHLKVAEVSGNTVDALERVSETLKTRSARYIEPAATTLKFGSLIIVAAVITVCLFSVYFPMYEQMLGSFD